MRNILKDKSMAEQKRIAEIQREKELSRKLALEQAVIEKKKLMKVESDLFMKQAQKEKDQRELYKIKYYNNKKEKDISDED